MCTYKNVIFTLVNVISITAMNIFLIGDSIDRQTVREWCFRQTLGYTYNISPNDSFIEYEWGPPSLTYT
jgi:hypothetical protein